MSEGTRLLHADEVARMLGISKTHLYHLARRGKIPSVKFERAVRFVPEDVEEFIQSNRRAGKEG